MESGAARCGLLLRGGSWRVSGRRARWRAGRVHLGGEVWERVRVHRALHRPAGVRGRGFGIQLWRAAMERLAGRNVGLDGVVAQQANYTASGFRLAFRNVRYQGVVDRVAGSGLPRGVVAASAVPFAELAAYDRTIFPASREAFLKSWLRQPEAGGFAAVEGERLPGYAVVRRCQLGWKIGPLAADDLATARRLYDATALHAGAGATLFLDVPAGNDAAHQLMAELGMTPVFETARMYTGADPAVDLSKLFGVTTFELG